jgi:uncharacterized protein YgiM (DUF1202 family)
LSFLPEPAPTNVDNNNEETMESLALSHSFVAYESPESELKLKSLDELGLKIPNSAWIGVASMAIALSVLAVPSEAQAGGCYRPCRPHHHHCRPIRHCHGHHGYRAKVVTNCSRLNIRKCPGRCSRIIGKLYNGDHVSLSGRHRGGWAELADGGWVSKKWIY